MLAPGGFSKPKLDVGKYRVVSIGLLSIMGLSSFSCGLFSINEAITDRSKPIRVVLDTPDVRRQIAERPALGKRGEADSRQQAAFVDAMADSEGVEIPPGSYCRVLERSEAICSKDPNQNPTYVKVLITTGGAKGQVGWGCLGDGITRLHAIP
jgi:hypothetical protein